MFFSPVHCIVWSVKDKFLMCWMNLLGEVHYWTCYSGLKKNWSHMRRLMAALAAVTVRQWVKTKGK